jgi:hypothetical protein
MIKKKQTKYKIVTCINKKCSNKFASLKIPDVLVGIQKCQICKNIMQSESYNNKKITINNITRLKLNDYIYENFDVKKFHKLIDTYKSGMRDDFSNLILKCVKGFSFYNIRDQYGEKGNEDIFLEYFGALLQTGEFFLKFEESFKIEKYFISIVVKDTLWNEAYVLFSKNIKKYRLLLAHYGQHGGQDSIYLMSTKNKFVLKDTLEELNNFNQQYHNLDKETPKSKYNLDAPNFRVCKPFKLWDTFNSAKKLTYKNK